MARKQSRTEEAARWRGELRVWLKAQMSRFKLDVPEIEAKSGVDKATLYRWLRADNEISPRLDSVMRVADSLGVAPPGASEGGRRPGFAEGDAQPYDGPPPADMANLAPNMSLWRISSRALELAGVLPGDVALLDQGAPARGGDVVIAQIYDFERGSAETKIRFFDGLYLQTRTMDKALDERPIQVDGERAVIMGRIVRLTRIMD